MPSEKKVFIKYLRTIVISFFLCCVAFFLLIYLQIGGRTESSRWIDEIYREKADIAASVEGPKLVLVGASDVLFGISCRMVHDELAIPCVNGGTHGGLDTDYLLKRARNWLAPGDTALLSLPYDLYKFDGKPRDVLIDYVLARDPAYVLSADWIAKPQFFVGVTWERLLRGILAKVSPPPPNLKSRYQVQNLNRYGDETINWRNSDTDDLRQLIDALRPQPVIDGYLSSTYAMEKISAFAAWCQTHGIRLLVTYPNTLWFDEYKGVSQQAFFRGIEDFHARLKVPILGNYKTFMYDRLMMYDTAYHLNSRGVQKRTRAIIQLLKPYYS